MDDDEQSGIGTAISWRPWTPAIGQKVRIRLSGECTLLRTAPGKKETKTAWHSHSEDGLLGTVIRPTPGVWMPRMDLPGHHYLVDFRGFTPDAVHFQGCMWYSALYFASTELDPAE